MGNHVILGWDIRVSKMSHGWSDNLIGSTGTLHGKNHSCQLFSADTLGKKSILNYVLDCIRLLQPYDGLDQTKRRKEEYAKNKIVRQ
jgi:hypothetical protein